MTDQKIIHRWLYAFARNADKTRLDDHVLSHGNHLWHVYIVAEDFSWTYVKTHENGWYGPYFCRCKPEAWAIGQECEEKIQ